MGWSIKSQAKRVAGALLFALIPALCVADLSSLASSKPVAVRQEIRADFAPRSSQVPVAFLDADYTLRITRSGKHSPIDATDFQILPGVAEKIHELNEQGFFVAIVSNQRGVPTQTPLPVAEAAMANLVQTLHEAGADVHFFDFSIEGDDRGKPKPAMATSLNEAIQNKFGKSYGIDFSRSLMVGDAAYEIGDVRPDGSSGRDFSDFDRKFAERLGIEFKEPDEFFGWRNLGVQRIKSISDIENLTELRRIDGERSAWKRRFSSRSDDIRRAETEIEARSLAIRKEGGTQAIFEGLRQPVESAEFNAALKKIDAERALQGQLDRLSQDEFELLLSGLYENSRLASDEVMILRPGARAKKLQASADRLQLAYENYQVEKKRFGQNKDYKRYASIVAFFKEEDRFVSVLSRLAPRSQDTSGARRLIDPFFETRKRLFERIGGFASVSANVARPAIKALVEAFRIESAPGKTAFSNAWLELFKKWGKASDLRVEVKGAENLALTDDGLISIVAPIHRDANLDAVALANLQMENSIVLGALNLDKHPVFGATSNPLMKPLVDALDSHDNFILVTSKREDPMDKMVRLLKNRKAKNLLVFPEGQVSMGMNETRPVRESFSGHLLTRLLAERIRFQIIPVTLENGGPLLHYKTALNRLEVAPGKNTLNVLVHPPIHQEVFEKLASAGHAEDFNSLLRAIWLENLPTDDHFVLGHARWDNVVKESEKLYPALSSLPCLMEKLGNLN